MQYTVTFDRGIRIERNTQPERGEVEAGGSSALAITAHIVLWLFGLVGILATALFTWLFVSRWWLPPMGGAESTLGVLGIVLSVLAVVATVLSIAFLTGFRASLSQIQEQVKRRVRSSFNEDVRTMLRATTMLTQANSYMSIAHYLWETTTANDDPNYHAAVVTMAYRLTSAAESVLQTNRETLARSTLPPEYVRETLDWIDGCQDDNRNCRAYYLALMYVHGVVSPQRSTVSYMTVPEGDQALEEAKWLARSAYNAVCTVRKRDRFTRLLFRDTELTVRYVTGDYDDPETLRQEVEEVASGLEEGYGNGEHVRKGLGDEVRRRYPALYTKAESGTGDPGGSLNGRG